MDAQSGLCTGCHRTLDEIAAWSVLDDGARRAIVAKLPARRAAFESGVVTGNDAQEPSGRR